MAPTEKIMDAVRADGVLSMRLGVDYLTETLLEQHEQFNRIRSMLAPVAPDPGLRDAIADVLLPKGSVGAFPPNYRQEVLDKADEIIAVLAERGVR